VPALLSAAQSNMLNNVEDGFAEPTSADTRSVMNTLNGAIATGAARAE